MQAFDHLLMPVGDLDAGWKALEDLGFTVTPRGHHSGLGTSNHLVTLDRVYFEVLSVTSPSSPHPAASLIKSGRTGLAFRTHDMYRDIAALRERRIVTDPVMAFGRPVAIDGADVEARFETAAIKDDQTPHSFMFLTRHLTPEYVWRPEWQRHRNAAETLTRVVLLCDDPERVAVRVIALFGQERVRPGAESVAVEVGMLSLEWATKAALQAEFPEAAFPHRPGVGVAVLTLRSSDLAAAEAGLGRTGAMVRTTARGSLWQSVPAIRDVVLEFVPAPK